MATLVALQMSSRPRPEENIETISSILTKNAHLFEAQETLVVLPECAAIFGCSGATMLSHAEHFGEGKIQQAFAELAQGFKIHLVAGSMPILPTLDSKKYYASSLLFDPQGQCQAQYNKIHLFDVDVADSTQAYRESKYTEAGKTVVTRTLPWCSLGMSICYDLRFSGLYKAMQGVSVIAVPSAFTQVTGQAHWHTLLKARAIENQAYVVAANQVGTHEDGRETFGNSCIYSPWGDLLSCIKIGSGVAVSTFDQEQLTQIRHKMPVFKHSLGHYE